MLIEQCALAKIDVLSANTDGIIVNLANKKKKKFTGICAAWEKQTQMQLEYTPYSRYTRRDVNNYTCLTLDNKVKNKGIFLPPDIKHDVQAPIIQRMLRAYFLYDIKPEEYLKDNFDELIIYDFLFSFGATKAFQIYLSSEKTKDIKLSKTNRWYITNNPTINNQLIKIGGIRNNTIKIPNSKNIILCNLITLTDLPSDIDYTYYFDKVYKLIEACSNE